MFAPPAPSPRVILIENMARLSERDQEFARDIMSKPSTPGRELWIGKLAERATRVAAAPATVGDIAPILAMFALPKSKLRWPAILIGDPRSPLRVTIAGEQAREPGSLTLTSATERQADGRRAWFGRVTLAGEFQPSRDLPKIEADAIHALLLAFARDPAGEARRFNKRSQTADCRTGRCCFCNKVLDDKDGISTALGWGRTCAGNWGLPWNKAAAAAVLAADGPEAPEPAEGPEQDSAALRALEAAHEADHARRVCRVADALSRR